MSESSTPEETPAEQSPQEPQAAQEGTSSAGGGGSRKLLLAVLGVLVVALAFDLFARWQANAALAALQPLIEESATGVRSTVGAAEGEVDPVTPEEVVEVIGKPQASLETYSRGTTQTFTWQGVIKHTLYVTYAPAPDGTLSIVEAQLNTPP